MAAGAARHGARKGARGVTSILQAFGVAGGGLLAVSVMTMLAGGPAAPDLDPSEVSTSTSRSDRAAGGLPQHGGAPTGRRRCVAGVGPGDPGPRQRPPAQAARSGRPGRPRRRRPVVSAHERPDPDPLAPRAHRADPSERPPGHPDAASCSERHAHGPDPGRLGSAVAARRCRGGRAAAGLTPGTRGNPLGRRLVARHTGNDPGRGLQAAAGRQLNSVGVSPLRGVIGFDIGRLARGSGSRTHGYLVNDPCKPIGANSKRTDFALAA